MRVLLVVNPTASSVTPRVRADVERILRARARPSTSPRRRAAATRPTLARDAVDATATTSSRCSPATARSTRPAAGSPASDVALAPLPGGSTNVFARTLGIAYAPDDAARAARRRRSARGSHAPHRARRRDRAGRRAASLPVPPRRRASTPPSSGAWRQRPSVKRHLAHPAFAATTVDDLAPPLRPRRRASASPIDGERGRRAGPTRWSPTPIRTPTSAAGRCASRRTRRSTTRSPSPSCARSRRAVVVRAAAAAVGRITYLTTSPEIVQRADVDAVEIAADAPFPWQVDGDYLGERRAARGRATRPTASPSSSPDAEPVEVGVVGDDGVDPGVAQTRPAGRRR